MRKTYKTNASGQIQAELVGSLAKGPDGNDFVVIGFECRGRNASQPSASEWLGYTYYSVDTDPSGNAIEISDGTNWVVMV